MFLDNLDDRLLRSNHMQHYACTVNMKLFGGIDSDPRESFVFPACRVSKRLKHR